MATKRTKPRKDFTQTALDVVRQATGETTAPAPAKKPGSGRKAAKNQGSTGAPARKASS